MLEVPYFEFRCFDLSLKIGDLFFEFGEDLIRVGMHGAYNITSLIYVKDYLF